MRQLKSRTLPFPGPEGMSSNCILVWSTIHTKIFRLQWYCWHSCLVNKLNNELFIEIIGNQFYIIQPIYELTNNFSLTKISHLYSKYNNCYPLFAGLHLQSNLLMESNLRIYYVIYMTFRYLVLNCLLVALLTFTWGQQLG